MPKTKLLQGDTLPRIIVLICLLLFIIIRIWENVKLSGIFLLIIGITLLYMGLKAIIDGKIKLYGLNIDKKNLVGFILALFFYFFMGAVLLIFSITKLLT